MGSPLAPVLANLFMGHHEKCWLNSFPNSNVLLFYRRYVDDIFCIFDSEQEAVLFFDFINTRHPNISFTMEKENNHIISFLDVLINNNSTDSPVTSIYHKKTYTGLLLNFFSFTSFSYKLGLVKTLVDRTYKINNTWKGFHLDLRQLRKTLQKKSISD